jgi:hypothetical protein
MPARDLSFPLVPTNDCFVRRSVQPAYTLDKAQNTQNENMLVTTRNTNNWTTSYLEHIGDPSVLKHVDVAMGTLPDFCTSNWEIQSQSSMH